MNKKNLIFNVLLLMLISSIASTAANAFVVLIDPGHGGEELGAISKVWIKSRSGKRKLVNVYEKDLSLRLAKLVKKKLDKNYTTYLTRSVDRTLTLEERSGMADTVKADLFISIHFNSSKNSQFSGLETYYLDNHKDVAIKKVEAIENKDLTGGDKIVNQILIDLVIQKTVSQSKKLANLVHLNLKKNVSKKFQVKDRGIKPGLFYVLALSKRPGILVEAGFMSNPKEIWKLKSKNYLDKYASAIANGVKSYFKGMPQKGLPLF